MEEKVELFYCSGTQSRATGSGFGLIAKAVNGSAVADEEAVRLRLIPLLQTQMISLVLEADEALRHIIRLW